MEEIWKQVEGHPHHFVSNMGRVKSIDHIVNDKGRPSHRKGKMLSLKAATNGYSRVVLEGEWFYVHRLVAFAFLPREEGRNVINHINGVKTDNNVSNLEWVTTKENCTHAYKIGLNKMTEERKEKISKSHVGMKHSEETKKKLREREYRSGFKLSLETRRKISESITKWHKEYDKKKIKL